MSFDPPKISTNSSNKSKHKVKLTSPDSNGSGGSPRKRPTSKGSSNSNKSSGRFGNDPKSIERMKKKMTDQDTKIRSLERDNQALHAKIRKYENTSSKKSKNVEKERELRLKANQDKYWLQEKLSKMQMAIQARLKLLNIDFSNCTDLSEALDAAFNAIQKLSAQLEEKDKELESMAAEFTAVQKQGASYEHEIEKLKKKMKKKDEVIDDQKKKMNQKSERLSQLGNKQDVFKADQQKLEDELQSLHDELDAERKNAANAMNEFSQKNAELADELANASSQNESLQSELGEQTKKNEELTSANDELQRKLQEMADELAKARADAQRAAEDALAKDEQNDSKITDLEDQLKASQDENESLREQLKKLKRQMRDMEDTMAIQDEEIAGYKSQFEQQKVATEKAETQATDTKGELTGQLDAANAEKAQLFELSKKMKEQIANKDTELKNIKDLYNDAKKQLDEILNKPMEEKAVQTDITGDWFTKTQMQIGRLDDLERSNKELQDIAQKHQDRLAAVVDENSSLLNEIDFLIKQAAKFRPDGSNHTGKMEAMVASPASYIVATSASDKTVRLWRIDPNADKKKCVPYACASMEGTALSLAFSRDGKYLVAGCAYKNGPDGALLVWNMEKNEGEVEILFRSRETLRFGRAHCVCWSDNNQYIFSGDTTGAIWVWDLINNCQLACINAHKDVVHDVSVSRGMLFSCSLDQTLCGFDINVAAKIPIKQDKLHLHKPKLLKATLLDKNERYPLQRVSPTEDLGHVVAGGRKIFVYKFDSNEQKVSAGPRVSDPDVDFIRALKVKNGLMIVCRQGLGKAKIFDVKTGKEVKKISYKKPASLCDFVWDMVHGVVICQEFKGKHAVPPVMKLWKFK